MQDEDIDLFSGDGLLAPELLPILGVAADHNNDPGIEDVIGDRGFAANMIADIFLDPTTYLTAGVTGIAKAAKGVRAGLHAKGAVKALNKAGIKPSQFKTTGELQSALFEATQAGKITNKGVRKATAQLGSVDKGTDLMEFLKTSGKEDLMISIPGLARWGAATRAPKMIREHKSWFAFQNNLFYGKKLGLHKPLKASLQTIGKGVRNLGPGGDRLIDRLGDLAGHATAFKIGASAPLRSKVIANLGDFGKDAQEAAEFRELFGKAASKAKDVDLEDLNFRLRKKLAKGADSEELLRTRGIHPSIRDLFREMSPKEITEAVPNLIDDLKHWDTETKELLDEAASSFKLREKDEFLKDKSDAYATAYKFGESLAKFRNKVFGRNNKINSQWVDDLHNDYLKSEAKAGLFLEQQHKQVLKDIDEVAKAEGMTADEISNILNINAEGTIDPLDLAANRRALERGGPDATSAAQNYHDILGRMRGTLEALKLHTGGLNSTSEEWLKVLDSDTFEVMEDLGFLEHWQETLQVTAKVVDPKKVPPELLGKRLSQLSTEELKVLLDETTGADRKFKRKVRKTLKARENGTLQHKPNFQAGGEATPSPQNHPLGPNLSPEMQAYADYSMALYDLERGKMTSLTIERLEKGAAQLGRLVPEQALASFKKADPETVKRLFGVRAEASRLAHQASGFSAGVPMGHMPRIRNRGREDAMRRLLGSADQLLEVKGVSANLKRRFTATRSLTLEELNSRIDEVSKLDGGKEIADQLQEILKKEGLEGGTYKQDHMDILFDKMSADFEQKNAADLINKAFAHDQAATEGLVGGRVLRVLDDEHNAIPLSRPDGSALKETKTAVTDDGLELTTRQQEGTSVARYVVIGREGGGESLIDLRQARNEGTSVEVMGNSADSLGHALVAHQYRGDAAGQLHKIEKGQWVALGGDDAMSVFRKAVSPPKQQWAEALQAYDTINFTLKKFQTVFRAAHHFGNLVSGIFQSQAAGASVGSIVRGHTDVMSVMLGVGEETGQLLSGRVAKATGFKGKFESGRKTADAIYGLVTENRKLDEFAGGITTADNILYEHSEIWEHALEGGVITGTFAREEVKIGGRKTAAQFEKSRKIESLRYKDDKTWTEGVANAWETALDTTHLPEITARMSTVYALIYDGHSLQDAVTLAKRAHVDYSTLGVGERQILKRGIPYYTFGRNYVPFALDRMAKSPRLIKGWQSAIEQSGMMGVDANGKVVIEEGQFQADLGRLNANIDAMMAAGSVVEQLLPGNQLAVDKIQKIQPAPFLAFGGGGAAGLAAKTFLSSDPDNTGLDVGGGLEALKDATFIGRALEKAAQSFDEKDATPIVDFSLSFLMPARFNADPDQAKRFQVNLARTALRSLETQHKNARSNPERQSIEQEAQQIQTLLETLDKDFN
jgi:hypothetical protein